MWAKRNMRKHGPEAEAVSGRVCAIHVTKGVGRRLIVIGCSELAVAGYLVLFDCHFAMSLLISHCFLTCHNPASDKSTGHIHHPQQHTAPTYVYLPNLWMDLLL